MYSPGTLQAARDLLEDCLKENVAITFDDVLLEPQFSDIETRKSISLETNVSPLRKITIPLIAANMDSVCESNMAKAMKDLGGLGVVHRYMSYEKQLEEVHKVAFDNGLTGTVIAAAIGVKNGVKEHVINLVNEGCKIIVIDVAHGHHKLVGDLLRELKAMNLQALDLLPVEFMAGNVATPEGVKYLCEAGADIIKVGVGPGSICSTRVVTGHGIPQLLAIAACSLVASQHGRTVIADGGARSSGDIVKALTAGANSIMCGSLLAGTDETPGEILKNETGNVKIYRGMASTEAQTQFYGNDPEAPEGVTAIIPCKGPVSKIVSQLVAGVKSGLSYSGCININQIQEKGSWVRTSIASRTESLPHINIR